MELLNNPLVQDAAIYLTALVGGLAILVPILRKSAKGVEYFAFKTLTTADDEPAAKLSGALMWVADRLDGLSNLIALVLPRGVTKTR